MGAASKPPSISEPTHTASFPSRGTDAHAGAPPPTYTTEYTDLGEVRTTTSILSPSAGSITDGDMESSEIPVSGLSLDEAADLTPRRLSRWIIYRIGELASTKQSWATFALEKKREKGATAAEAEWYATELTGGYVDSIPFEIRLAMLLLEDKLVGSSRETTEPSY